MQLMLSVRIAGLVIPFRLSEYRFCQYICTPPPPTSLIANGSTIPRGVCCWPMAAVTRKWRWLVCSHTRHLSITMQLRLVQELRAI